MRGSKKLLAFVAAGSLILGTGLALASSGTSKATGATGSSASRMEKKSEVRRVRGEVTAVEPGAKTMVVKAMEGKKALDVGVDVTDKTIIREGKANKTLGDIKVGTHLKKIGDVLPVAEKVALGMNAGMGVFSASGNGLLALRSADQAERETISVDRAGKRGEVVVAKGETAFGSPGLSPDGKLLAEGLGTVSQRDIWIVDAARAASTRFSFRSGITRNPVWSPDGSRIAYGYQNNAGLNYDIVVKPANGTGQEELLLAAGVNTWPSDWSPDGKFLLIQQTGQNTAIDLALLPIEAPKPGDGTRKVVPFAQTPFDETQGRFSPDGKWIAYVSNESGRNQVYLQTYPTTGAKYQVSTAGGVNTRWRRDGKEIYFLSADGKVMAAPVKLGSGVELGTPQALFADVRMTNFIPTPDGQNFFVNVPAGDENAAPMLTVITNWQAALKK